MKRKLLSLLLGVVMISSLLAGCGGSSSGSKNLIGVAMPTKELRRWTHEGSDIEKMLKEIGYEVDLQYANNDIASQISQIEEMIANGCKLLVINAIDGDSLGNVLQQAKEKNVSVIAYDRLIMNSDAVSYYATFDNYMIGQKQGKYIVETLDLENSEGSFNLEVFTGDPGDNNVKFFYNGAIDVLQPYIDSGKLVIPSGQLDFTKVATVNWSSEKAQSRMENIISSFYAGGEKLDVVLCSNDSTALGVTNALDDVYRGDWPIITGQDCDIANVKNVIAGKQSMSIFKDSRDLVNQVVKMVDAIMKGEKAPVNDTSTYDNGVRIVPSYLCASVFVDKDNYEELLIESGYYTAEELK